MGARTGYGRHRFDKVRAHEQVTDGRHRFEKARAHEQVTDGRHRFDKARAHEQAGAAGADVGADVVTPRAAVVTPRAAVVTPHAGAGGVVTPGAGGGAATMLLHALSPLLQGCPVLTRSLVAKMHPAEECGRKLKRTNKLLVKCE
ncbi:unnamed protein product [Closterium sp. NIES-54]